MDLICVPCKEVISMLSVYKNQVMIEHYKEVQIVTSACIQVRMASESIQIKGENLHVLALEAEELLLEGDIEEILFYDKT